LDKLDGRITEEFWERKSAEWRQEEERLQVLMRDLDEPHPNRLRDGARILELANKAHFLYLRQNSAEKP
jgi:site-specific DNA recombinase